MLMPYRDEPRYNDWLTTALKNMAQSGSPYRALQMAESIQGEAAYEKAIVAIVGSWTIRDVEAAAEWVRDEAVISNRAELISTVAGQWSGYDLRAAKQWVMSFKQSADRDAGLNKLMENPYLTSQEADAILRSIKSSSQRYAALETYIRQVARYDPQAARVYVVRQVKLSDEAEKLMTIIEDAENGAL